MPKGRGRRVLFWSLYVLGLCLLLEVAGRLTWRVLDKTWGLIVPQEISRFDDNLGWSLSPGARAASKSTGTRIDYEINEKGFRGPAAPYEKPSGTFRVVLLGDSHAFGFGVPLDKHFSTLLEGYFENLQVINLGVNGYGLDQEYLLLTSEGFRYQPDMVVAYVPHYADFRHLRDKVWGMGKPRFVLEGGRLVPTNAPVANNSPLYRASMDLDRFASSVSRAYEMARDTVIHFRATRAKVAGPPPSPELVAEANALGQAIVLAMAEACRERGVRFVLATRIGELAVAALKAGLDCVYIADPLINPRLALAADPTRHPNEPANGLIAWEIARYLRGQGLVPEGDHVPASPVQAGDEAAPGSADRSPSSPRPTRPSADPAAPSDASFSTGSTGSSDLSRPAGRHVATVEVGPAEPSVPAARAAASASSTRLPSGSLK